MAGKAYSPLLILDPKTMKRPPDPEFEARMAWIAERLREGEKAAQGGPEKA